MNYKSFPFAREMHNIKTTLFWFLYYKLNSKNAKLWVRKESAATALGPSHGSNEAPLTQNLWFGHPKP